MPQINHYYVEVGPSDIPPYNDVFYIQTGRGTDDDGYYEAPYLEACEWKTYYFHQTGVSNVGHSFRFSDYPGGVPEGGTEYTTGVIVTGTPGQADAYTSINMLPVFDPIAPPLLYYYCNNHSEMGGNGWLGIEHNDDCTADPVWYQGFDCESNASVLFRAPSFSRQDIIQGAWDPDRAILLYSGGKPLIDNGYHGPYSGCFTDAQEAITMVSGHSEVFAEEVFEDPSGDNHCNWCSERVSGLLDSCTIASGLSGVLTGLIHDTNVGLSGQYETFTTLSYSIETGYDDGQFLLCEMVATGTNSTEALLGVTDFVSWFSQSGRCYDERFGPGVFGEQNIHNTNLTFDGPYTYESLTPGIYLSHVSGFTDRRYYVTYTPIVSGEKTVVSVDVECPDTDLEVKLDRNVQGWWTTGFAVDEAEAISSLTGTLLGACSGYRTDLTIQCKKIEQGKIRYCEKEAFNKTPSCWEGVFHAGDYSVIYETGSFMTSGDNYFVGTGELSTYKLI